MPSTARRDRERAEGRARIVEAALHVLEVEGVAAMTMRRIAAVIEYSAPVVYQHFANKDALMVELISHGHAVMLADFERVIEGADVDRQMTRIARDYVRFAGEHPHLYELMNSPAVGADERRRAAEPVIALLQALIISWSDRHDVAVADPAELCEVLWGTLHGIASLGAFPAIGDHRARGLAQRAVRALLLGWRHDTATADEP